VNSVNKSSKLVALLGFAFLISIPLAALASLDYTVKKGDTLSHIANHFIKGQKLYGTDGSVSKLMRLNTTVKDANIIEPGQIIILSKAMQKEIKKAQVKDQVKALLSATDRTYSIFENPIKRTNKKIQFTISTSLTTNHLDLVNSDTRIATSFATRPSLGAQAKLQYLIGKRLNLELSAAVKSLNFKRKSGANASMSSNTFVRIGTHATYLVGNSVRLKAGIKNEGRAYALSGSEIIKKQITSPELGLSLKLDESNKSVSTMSVLFSLLPEDQIGTEAITAGLNTRAALGFQWDHLNVEPFLNWANQDIEASSQHNLDLGLNLGYRF
jgi:LysM repeat protein